SGEASLAGPRGRWANDEPRGRHAGHRRGGQCPPRHTRGSRRSGMYLNFRQCDDWNAVELVVRATRPAGSLAPDVRTVMKTFDPNLPATEFTTLEQIVDHAVAPRKLITRLLGAFSSLALVL